MPNAIRNPFDSGYSGGVLINTTTPAKSGTFFAIQVITNAVFTTLTGNLSGDGYGGQTFPAGTVIYGSFTSVQLASGCVIAYQV